MFYDLSQTIQDGMAFYPGDPEPRISRAEIEPPWMVSELRIGSHTGTHIDAARHYYPGGAAIDAYPIERFVLPGIVLDARDLPEDEPIAWRMIETAARGLPPGGAAVLRTGWDRFWADDERRLRHPYLSAEAARGLAGAGATLVGTDAMNVDSSVSGTTVAHETFLGRDILIVENLARLDVLAAGTVYRFSFLPLRLGGLDGSPIRAVAWSGAATTWPGGRG